MGGPWFHDFKAAYFMKTQTLITPYWDDFISFLPYQTIPTLLKYFRSRLRILFHLPPQCTRSYILIFFLHNFLSTY